MRRGQILAIKVGSALRIKKYSLDQAVRRRDKRDRPTMLVADDDPDVRQLFRIFFKEIGFNGVVACTAKAAICSGSRNSISCFWTLSCPKQPRSGRQASQAD